MTAMPELSTERLLVRPFTAADLDAYVAAFGTTPAEADPYLRWAELNHAVLASLRQPPWGDRAVVLRETGALVGSVGLVPQLGPFAQLYGEEGAAYNAEAGLYWATAEAHRRQGFATEAARALIDYAFDELKLARVVATTQFSNTASIAVMRKLGMRIHHNPQPDPPWLQVVGVLPSRSR